MVNGQEKRRDAGNAKSGCSSYVTTCYAIVNFLCYLVVSKPFVVHSLSRRRWVVSTTFDVLLGYWSGFFLDRFHFESLMTISGRSGVVSSFAGS